jgi:hypothetical protein
MKPISLKLNIKFHPNLVTFKINLKKNLQWPAAVDEVPVMVAGGPGRLGDGGGIAGLVRGGPATTAQGSRPTLGGGLAQGRSASVGRWATNGGGPRWPGVKRRWRWVSSGGGRRPAVALLWCGYKILFVSFGLGGRGMGRDFLNSSGRTLHSSVNR